MQPSPKNEVNNIYNGSSTTDLLIILYVASITNYIVTNHIIDTLISAPNGCTF